MTTQSLQQKMYGNPPIEVRLDHTQKGKDIDEPFLLVKADPNGRLMDNHASDPSRRSVGQTWLAPRKRQAKVNTSLEKRNFWERSNSLWL